MSNQITVTVEGETGTGKTALCQLICLCLEEYKVPVEKRPDVLSKETNYSELRSKRNLMKAISTLILDGMTVEVVEKNIPR